MIKKIALFTVMLTLLISAFTVCASGAEEYVHDGGYLTDSERAALSSRLQTINSHDRQIHVVLADSRTALNNVIYNYYTAGDAESLTVFFIEYDSYDDVYYYELLTYGHSNDVITDSEANLILDDAQVYDNVKSGKLYIGAARAIDLIDVAEEGRLRKEGWLLRTVLVSLVLGCAVGGIAVIIVVTKYKKKLKSPIYPQNEFITFNPDPTVSTDVFVNKTLTRVRVVSSSARSRSGGGGFSGGGSRGRR